MRDRLHLEPARRFFEVAKIDAEESLYNDFRMVTISKTLTVIQYHSKEHMDLCNAAANWPEHFLPDEIWDFSNYAWCSISSWGRRRWHRLWLQKIHRHVFPLVSAIVYELKTTVRIAWIHPLHRGDATNVLRRKCDLIKSDFPPSGWMRMWFRNGERSSDPSWKSWGDVSAIEKTTIF